MLLSAYFAIALQTADPHSLVQITVAQDRHYTLPHTITIAPERAQRPQSQEQRDRQAWFARRVWDGGEQLMTSDECPALRRVALSFGELPPIEVRPDSLEVAPGGAVPIPPSRKDGFGTSLSFRSLTADGSSAVVQIRGGNAYAEWGHNAVAALIPCWGPLTPDPTS